MLQALAVLLEQGVDLSSTPVGSTRTYGALALQLAVLVASPGVDTTCATVSAPAAAPCHQHAECNAPGLT